MTTAAAAGITTVQALIEHNAAVRSEAVYALDVDGARGLDYRALARSCRQVGALLASNGVAAGDTVSLVMPNGLQTVQWLLGAMHAGVCVNPVNLLSQAEQMRHVLGHSDCKLVCVAPEWEARVRALLAGIGRPVAVIVAAPDALLEMDGTDCDARPGPPLPPSPDTPALLMYTSGTTGIPKGVLLSHAGLVANAQAISAEHALTPADRVLAVLPLYHINAFVVTMLAPLAHGGSLALAPRFSAARFWEQAATSRCTWINLVPTMISYLLEGDAPPPTATAGLRFCRSASAPLPPDHLRGFERRFGIGIVETMGLTETAAPSFSNPLAAGRRKLGSVGPASGCEARVIDADLREVADGTTGEIAVRGPNLMLGYYKDVEATRGAFTPDGWLRTGDLGHRDADGFFFVTGRIKELIIKGGENIAPREIDEALLAHPAVQEAAAVGIPDRHYGQQIMACVVLREGASCSAAELTDFCRERLGPFKTPALLRFVAALPRGPSGKVQRLKLLDLRDDER